MNRAQDLAARRESELRRQRRAQYAARIHKLGVRVVVEIIDQFSKEFDEARVDHLLERFAGLDPDILHALGADKLPPLPIRLVGGNRR